AIWLSNALALAVILQRPPRDWGLYAGATAAGNLAMGLLHGDGWPLSLGIAGCNVGEVMIAATLLRLCRATDILGSLRSLLLFFGLAVGVSTGLSAAAGALLVSSLFSGSYLTVLHTWWIADAVGVIVLTPALTAFCERGRPYALTLSRIAEACAIGAGLVAV